MAGHEPRERTTAKRVCSRRTDASRRVVERELPIEYWGDVASFSTLDSSVESDFLVFSVESDFS